MSSFQKGGNLYGVYLTQKEQQNFLLTSFLPHVHLKLCFIPLANI